ncbi:BREX-1 system adenine-specific DNA-methyltransferase PglX [Weeksella virosa]|uniref:BREX-1 system adenine-specific DNA-methyltransferase PglX n=1 Tax=Weeksella virosa TaxID=1014 RepID=UPI0021AA7052|nr:BREX-1 system adenine-specific DNA-methyltransferase PglX [Weeksella virosa]
MNSHNGIKEKGVKRIEINDYPSIKKHLDQYYPRLEKRADKGDTPYNLRNCAYMEDFYKQKIVWKAVGRNLTFSLLEPGSFLTAPASFITSNYNLYILAFLSSSYGKYFIYNNSDTTGAGDIMLNIQSLEKIPIPQKANNRVLATQLESLVDKILNKKTNLENTTKIEEQIDTIIYEMFDFTCEEIYLIKNI